eukprot:1694809-Pleurochrysis_carterae.AAC.1
MMYETLMTDIPNNIPYTPYGMIACPHGYVQLSIHTYVPIEMDEHLLGSEPARGPQDDPFDAHGWAGVVIPSRDLA